MKRELISGCCIALGYSSKSRFCSATYVAEQNLDLEENPKAIQHPLINSLFTKFDGSQYHLKSRTN